MRRFILVFVSCLVILGLLMPAVALAHISGSSNGISVLLHITPDDKPTAGQMAKLGLSVRHQGNPFAPVDCTCQATLWQSNIPLKRVAVMVGHSGNFSLDQEFVKAGVYSLAVSGQVKSVVPGVAASRFQVDFDFRVEAATDRDANQLSSLKVTLAVFIILLQSIIGIAIYTSIWHHKNHR